MHLHPHPPADADQTRALASEQVRALVAVEGGRLVPHTGFDELLVQMGRELDFPALAPRLKDRNEEYFHRHETQENTLLPRMNAPRRTTDTMTIRATQEEAAEARRITGQMIRGRPEKS